MSICSVPSLSGTLGQVENVGSELFMRLYDWSGHAKFELCSQTRMKSKYVPYVCPTAIKVSQSDLNMELSEEKESDLFE